MHILSFSTNPVHSSGLIAFRTSKEVGTPIRIHTSRRGNRNKSKRGGALDSGVGTFTALNRASMESMSAQGTQPITTKLTKSLMIENLFPGTTEGCHPRKHPRTADERMPMSEQTSVAAVIQAPVGPPHNVLQWSDRCPYAVQKPPNPISG